MPEAKQVHDMFARIAGRYDLLNRTLSMGIDRRWRRRAAKRIGALQGSTLLDVCTGTGDLALEFALGGAKVLGVDFTYEMLAFTTPKSERQKSGKRPSGETAFAQGDALALPLADNSVDGASVAFGIRNVADRLAGMAEMARVVKPGGKVLVLEFSMPKGAFLGTGYRVYFRHVLPRVGGWVSGDRSAYEYLPDSVLKWPTPEQLRDEMASLGLVNCDFESLTGGVACLHWGTVPAEPSRDSDSRA